MLPKTQRLTANRIEYLFKKGKKSGNSFLTIKYLANSHQYHRFCVIVSSEIFPNAIQRNHLRRQLYQIFRLHPELPAVPSDLVVIAKPSLTKLNFQELQSTIIQTLQHITL